MKVKYLTKQEKDDKIHSEVEFFVEKLEKRYQCQIMWNMGDIIYIDSKYAFQKSSTK